MTRAPRQSMMRDPGEPSKAVKDLVATGPAPAARRVSMGERSAGNRTVRLLHAAYDAAQTHRENARHWANADALSADAANSLPVRQFLRNRARYECANNTYARGMVNTKADSVIGTGPRLQLRGPDRAANRRVEALFDEWACEIGLCEKLRTMRISQAESGEVFLVMATNPAIDGPVQLDLRMLEADQVSTPYLAAARLTDPNMVDGIEFDGFGNPKRYHVLKQHPGNTNAVGGLPFDADPIDASLVIHAFRPERPGQSRGIPEITAALPLFAMLRRYTLATLVAAENAANIAGVIYTDAPGEEADEVEPLDEFEIDRGTWMSMPVGWKPTQFKAEQPVEGYSAFKKEVLNEIARVLDMPYNIAAGNSSGYNYSSGRLDHQAYHRSVKIDRHTIERRVLRRIFRAWLAEAALISGMLPQQFRTRDVPQHQWFWDGQEHVDPVKEANAQATRLASGTTTLANECALAGADWEEVLEQRAAEINRCRELGIPLQPQVASAAQIEQTTDSEERDS